MDFRKIEYFLQVAKLLNFSRAAEEIHISHQALSKHIRSLEDDLGVTLFERTTTKVVLTEAGRKLYQAFDPIVESAYREYAELERFIEYRKSKLAIGYFNALSYRAVIEPVVEYLKSKKQDLSVDVLSADVGDVRERLMEDKIDLLITAAPDLEKWNDVQYHILNTFPLKIIVSSKHPWYKREEPVTVNELEKESLLYYQAGEQDFMQQMKVAERIPIQNYDTYVNRLYSGQEIGVIADIFSPREGQFKLLELPGPYKSDISIIAAYKKEHPLKELFNQLKKYR